MKTQLIKTQDKFILVSDEEIKIGDCIMTISGIGFTLYTSFIAKNENDGTKGWNDVHCKKIISENPDFSDLKEEDCKRIGWVDVEKLAEIAFENRLTETNQDISWVGYGKGVDGIEKSKWINIWIKGFKTAQSLNDKMFSLEEMKEGMDRIVRSTYVNKGDNVFDLFIEMNRENYINEYIQSLQQTVWDVEVEMDCVYQGKCVKERCLIHSCDETQPKITDGSIKILKVL